MAYLDNTVCIQNLVFRRITEQTFKKINISELQFLMISQSGVVDTAGNIYFFTHDTAFFMDKTEYSDGFIDKILSIVHEWNLVNVYFCDFLIINPKIYDFFIHKLCEKNIRCFWFETAIDIYKTDILTPRD